MYLHVHDVIHFFKKGPLGFLLPHFVCPRLNVVEDFLPFRAVTSASMAKAGKAATSVVNATVCVLQRLF